VKAHLPKTLLLTPLMTMKYTSMLLDVEIKKKGYVYGFGALRKRFTSSKSVDSTTNQPLVVHQIEEM